MATGFKFAKTSSLVNTGNFTPLSATMLSQSPTGLKIWLKAGQNAVMRIDAAAVEASHSAAAIASEMVFETGVPNATSWVDVGNIDPSRVWIRSGAAALTDHCYWIASWN